MEFYDYKTLPVSGNQVVDSTKTGMTFYDQFLTTKEQDYLNNVKNLQGEIVQMSPEEYYDACAKYGFPNSPVSVENLKRTRRAQTKILDHLKDVLLVYKKRFPMPMLNIAQKGQEGLHRMMVIGDLFGWDHKVPVLVITHFDEDRAQREEQERYKYDIDRNIERAIELACRYTYYSLEELEQQLVHEIATRFEYRDDIEVPTHIQINETSEGYTFTFSGFEYCINKEDVHMEASVDQSDLELNDLDDDFLIRYFGDNWEEEFPELRTKFNIDESFNQNNKLNRMEFFRALLAELSEFDYAFIDGEGKELHAEDAMDAVVQSPEQLADLGKGVCTDFVEYTRAKLDERNIPYKVYDIACTDKDGDHPAHVFVAVEHEGKFLWLEAAWHSEAGIHEYNSLEELFEDIARKHCIYDGENYLESCEIREIKKSLVGMSQEAIYEYIDTLPITWKAVEEGITEELKSAQGATIEAMNKAIISEFGRDYPGEGCICIAPDGTFINVYPKLDDHEDLCTWLTEQGFDGVIPEAEWLVETFDYVRCRNNPASLCYIELPLKTITRSQLYSLEEWLEDKVSHDHINIELPDGVWKRFSLEEYFPEDIIKKIKRYYASGTLYEKLK